MEAIMFREFRHQYRKAQRAYKELAVKGPFTLKMEGAEESAQVKHETPSDEGTVRLVVLMRPFLAPSSPLYVKKQWRLLQEQFADDLPPGSITHIEQLIETLDKGYLPLKVNGKDVTAETVYQIISEADYFDENEAAQEKLRNLAAYPMVGPILWYQFHDYTLVGFELVSALFDIILEVEKTEKYRSLYGKAEPAINKCLYCLSTEGTFESEEHVFPESLGNDEIVLPKGFVCDTCNNVALSSLDKALLEFELVAFLQVQFVPHTKQGKLPQANFQDMTVKKVKPRQIVFTSKDGKDHIEEKQPLEDGRQSFTMQGTMRKIDWKLLGRAIYKIALGTVAFLQGHEEACSSKYEASRNFILGKADLSNNLLMTVESKPHPYLRAEPIPAREGTPYFIDIYGLRFIVNLEPTPVVNLSEELIKHKFALFPLNGEPS
jgi:HNH endonuclease